MANFRQKDSIAGHPSDLSQGRNLKGRFTKFLKLKLVARVEMVRLVIRNLRGKFAKRRNVAGKKKKQRKKEKKKKKEEREKKRERKKKREGGRKRERDQQ